MVLATRAAREKRWQEAMTVSGSTPSGALAIFDLIADFLEKFEFKSAASAIKAQRDERAATFSESGFARSLRDFLDNGAMVLAEVESNPGALARRETAAEQTEKALEQLVDGLLRKLMASGRFLSDETLGASIDAVLTSDAFAKLTLQDGGALSKSLAGGYNDLLSIDDIDVHKYWEQIQRESQGDAAAATRADGGGYPASESGVPPLALLADAEGAAKAAAPTVAEAQGAGGAEASEALAVAPVQPDPSQHYAARRPRGSTPGADEDWEEDDEYRDDDDPGYRIREIYETELLAELSHKQQPPRSGSSSATAPSGRVPPGAIADELSACSVAEGASDTAKSESAAPAQLGGSGPAEAWPGTDEAGASIATSAATGPLPEDSQILDERPSSPTFGSGALDGSSTGLESSKPTEAQTQSQSSAAADRKADEHRQRDQQKEKKKARKNVKYAASGDGFYPVELDGVVFDSFNLRVVFERDKTGFEESKELPILMNSVVAARYQIMEYLGSAAFSRAVQCLDLENNKPVCMKIIKNDKDFFDQSLDEIKLLKYININGDVDRNCVLRLYDYFYHKEHLIIVTELLRDNLYEFSKFNRECGDQPYFTLGRLQKIARQVLTALDYVHSLSLIHCDLKPENILIKSYSRCEVKVIDFGSSCFVDDHLSSYVQSRSYRAPEVMLGLPYDQKIDLWSLGCILAELWTGYVLFQNDSVQSLLARILGIVGDFPYHMMTRGRYVPQYFTQDGQLYQETDGAACPERGRRLHLLVPKRTCLRQRMRTDSEEFLDFLTQLLQLDPAQRPTAAQAMEHPWLSKCRYPDGI